METVLVTGCAGFIGSGYTEHLLSAGYTVVGLDNINDYYDPSLKRSRLHRLGIDPVAAESGGAVRSSLHPAFTFIKADIEHAEQLDRVFRDHRPAFVVHLAAQVGVRYSVTHPHKYLQSNVLGFMNVLESCRAHSIQHLVYATSSSVYGANKSIPFSVKDSVDHPMSFYAATKKANELMAHSYSSLYNIPTTGLRFFTVYGPWGRPDMAMFLFTKRIFAGEAIDVYNFGKMRRDFTYVDDIINGIRLAMTNIPAPDPQWDAFHPTPAGSYAPYRVFNIGNHRSVELMDFIGAIERHVGKKAVVNLLPMQPGDVVETYADITEMERLGYSPSTNIEEGVGRFVAWYKDYYIEKKYA